LQLIPDRFRRRRRSLALAMHILAGDRGLQGRLHRAAAGALGEARVLVTFADTAKFALFGRQAPGGACGRANTSFW
jgi:hypothetical protein